MIGPQKDKHFEEERRREERLKGALVEYSFKEGDSSKVACFLRDISISGASIVVSEAMEINTILYLDIYLPHSNTPVVTKGKVTWREESSYLGVPERKDIKRKHYDLGIELIEIDEDNQKKLAEYLSHFTKDESSEDF